MTMVSSLKQYEVIYATPRSSKHIGKEAGASPVHFYSTT